MNPSDSHDDQLERFLDGLMSEKEASDFLQDADSTKMKNEHELQDQIDNSLRRMMSGVAIDPEQIESQFLAAKQSASKSPAPATHETGRRQWLQLAAAASVLLALGISVYFQTRPQRTDPVDSVQQLAGIYDKKVGDGFRPYYVCDDPNRFAETFEVKLGQGLVLAAMPADRSMIGISYLGGVSRETVAMLAEVQDKPVIVFVDREGKPGLEEAIRESESDLNVFVERKFGLVFIEVTPLPTAGMIQHFQRAQ